MVFNTCQLAATGGFPWATIIASLLALAGVLATIVYGVKTTRRTLETNLLTTRRTLEANLLTTRRTLRANILTAHRLKWLDLLRDEVPTLLALGERLYDPNYAGSAEETLKIKIEMRAVSRRLIVLLGRENTLRMDFAEVVRRFADAPTEDLAEQVEVFAQQVFRARWNQVREETGEPARDKPTLPRSPGAPESTLPQGDLS